MGADSAAAAIKQVLAMGADEGVLLNDPAFEDGDEHLDEVAAHAASRHITPQFRNGGCPGNCLPVRPHGRHGVVGIDNGHDVREQRHIRTAQSIGIAAAIQPLVMVPHNRAHQRERPQVTQQPLADFGMLLDEIAFNVFAVGFREVEKQAFDREYSADEIWAAYTYFFKAVLPVAEEAGVTLALHPDDPPLVWEAWTGAAWEECELERDETGGLNKAGDVVLKFNGRPVAGAGELPIAIAQGAKANGRNVFLLALEGIVKPEDAEAFPHAFISLGELGKALRLLKEAGCAEITLAGKVARPEFTKLKLDARGALALPRVMAAAVKGDDALLRALLNIFESEGLRVVGSEETARELLGE